MTPAPQLPLARRLRHLLAAVLIDAPRYAWALRRTPRGRAPAAAPWVRLRNRGERLTRQRGQRGVRCEWRWTSALFLPQSFPGFGRLLLRRTLREWPIGFAATPDALSDEPVVSFIVGHRGAERIPHLRATLASLAAQEGVPFEVLVVEQARSTELACVLPDWVRHVHTPPPREDMPYSRAWAFNRGALAARGRILVFHDNDICAPRAYARELVTLLSSGFEAARLQRFVFYLGEEQSDEVCRAQRLRLDLAPALVVQNCEGHTLAVSREAYAAIGGHDEGFLGWGGEDNEILDRLRSLRLHDHAYLVFLHLHHAPQPGKAEGGAAREYFEQRMRLAREARIAELGARPLGRPEGPWTPAGAKA